MTTPLDPQDVTRAIAELAGWAFENDALTRSFEFSSFREAISFIVRVAFEADGLDHHPEIRNVYSHVVLTLTTHDAGDRVTARDVELARRIQRLSWV